MAEEVRANKNSSTEIDFDVCVEGVDSSKMSVRFVIEQVDNFDLLLTATHVKDNKWKVNIPALGKYEKDEFKLRVEVIAEDYFFTPVKDGRLAVIADPIISLVKEESDLLQEKVSMVMPSEGSPSITTTKLVPEEEPKQSKPQKAPNDEQIETEKLEKIASKITPKDDGAQYIPSETMAFDAKTAAQQIINNIMNTKKIKEISNNVSNKFQKRLFSRTKSGKVVIPGVVENEEYLQELNYREEKIKALLKDIK